MKKFTSVFLAVLLTMALALVGYAAVSDNIWTQYETARRKIVAANSIEFTTTARLGGALTGSYRLDMSVVKKKDGSMDSKSIVIIPKKDGAITTSVIDGIGYYELNKSGTVDYYHQPAGTDIAFMQKLADTVVSVELKKSHIESATSKQLENGDTEITFQLSPKALDTLHTWTFKDTLDVVRSDGINVNISKVRYTVVISSDNTFKTQSFDISGKMTYQGYSEGFRMVSKTEILGFNHISAIPLPVM